MATLEERHRNLSRALHPDRHLDASPHDRRLALSRAIEVNEAYRRLKDPISRAEALLRRAAPGDAPQEARGSNLGAPPSLLEEVMELREALAGHVQKKDAPAVAALGAAVDGRRRAAEAALGEIIDAGPLSEISRKRADSVLTELRYWRRFLDEVAAFEDLF